MGNRLLIRQHKEEPKAGIIIDEEAVKKRPIGTILEVSPQLATGLYAKGDTVCFNELAGETVAHGGEVFLVIDVKDVLVKLINEGV